MLSMYKLSIKSPIKVFNKYNNYMSNAYKPNYHNIDEIFIKEIVFEKDINEANVSIFGYYDNPAEEGLVRVDYFCDFATLTGLLVAAKEAGDSIIDAITEKLGDKTEEYPVLIDVEAMCDGPLLIQDIVLTIYKPMVPDENGVFKEEKDNNYIIDSFDTKEDFEKKQSIPKDAPSQMAGCFVLLEAAQQYYLQLLQFGETEKSARKKSGLKNELLFRMAGLNNLMIKEG